MRRVKLMTLTAAGIALGASLPLAAQAQMVTSREGIALQNEILALKHQIQAMKQQQGGGGTGGSVLGAPPSLKSQGGGAGGSNELVPNLLEQVQTLNAQVQDLRGRVDRLEHEVATQSGEINQEIGNLKFQLNQGGQGGFPAQSGPGASGQPTSGPAAPGQATQGQGAAGQTMPGQPKATGRPAPGTLGTLPEGAMPKAAPEHQAAKKPREAEKPAPAHHEAAPPRAEASLKSARAALAHHDYAAAEAAARAIIAKKGRGADHGAAELVLADSLSHQGRHQEAAIAYDDAYNASHSGPYAPDALLGLANSLSAIHQNQEACDTLDSLQSQFSSPSASLAARIRAARRRAHCG